MHTLADGIKDTKKRRRTFSSNLEDIIPFNPYQCEYSTPILDPHPWTEHGTVPLRGSSYTFRERVHVTLPRDLDSIHPDIIKMLIPHSQEQL